MSSTNNTPNLKDVKAAMKRYNADAAAQGFTHDEARKARRGPQGALMVGLIMAIASAVAVVVLQ